MFRKISKKKKKNFILSFSFIIRIFRKLIHLYKRIKNFIWKNFLSITLFILKKKSSHICHSAKKHYIIFNIIRKYAI